MAHTKHLSSPQVMFSDKGSTFFGITLVVLMVTLSLAFVAFKFKTKRIHPPSRVKVQKLHKKRSLLVTTLKSKNFLLLHYPQKISKQSIKKVKLKESEK